MSSVPGQLIPFQPGIRQGKPKVPGAPVFAGNGKEAGQKPLAFDPLHRNASADRAELRIQANQTLESGEKTSQIGDQAKATGWNRLFGDKTRLAAGFILEDVVPPLLGFAFVAGPVGWLVTLGSLPLSYASGKLGRHIASGVDKNNLPQGMKSFQDFRESFRNRDKLKGQYDLLNKWNVLIDDALNVRSGHAKMLAGILGNYLKVSKDSKVGRILSSKQFLKANIYHDVAQANTVSGAFKAGAKGGIGFWFYNVCLPGVGLALEKASSTLWGPFKWPFMGLGLLLKNYGLLKLGKDVLSTPKSKVSQG